MLTKEERLKILQKKIEDFNMKLNISLSVDYLSKGNYSISNNRVMYEVLLRGDFRRCIDFLDDIYTALTCLV